MAELDTEVADPALWDDPRRAATLTQELSHIREELAGWETLGRRAADARDLAELMGDEAEGGESGADPAMVTELAAEIDEIERELGAREVDLLYSDPYTDNPALLSVKSGAGGRTARIGRRCCSGCSCAGRSVTGWRSNSSRSPRGRRPASSRPPSGWRGGAPSACSSRSAACTGWSGSAPSNSAHRRHTSFVLVEVTPEVEDDVTVEIDPKDVREDVYRSSGAGGQHVNKTSSAVRLTHIPTGIVVTCQNERSQHQNRDVAWRVLRSRLLAVAQAAHAERISELKGESLPAEWGSQIRSYVLHPYTMVKDHRTGHEVGNVQAVLDGDIDSFQEAYLRWAAGKADAAASAAATTV